MCVRRDSSVNSHRYSRRTGTSSRSASDRFGCRNHPDLASETWRVGTGCGGVEPFSRPWCATCSMVRNTCRESIAMAVSHSTHPVTPQLVHSSFAQVLHANGPDPGRARELELSTQLGDGEIHAGWVLEGRAIRTSGRFHTCATPARD